MEALNLVEVVLNNGHEEEIDKTAIPSSADKSSPIKGLDESVTITVTRNLSRPTNMERLSGKPANFAMLSSPTRNGRNSDALRTSPREEMVCNVCERAFKYRAAFLRHEAQCGLPIALKMERAAIIEAKKMEKAILFEKRKMEVKQEKLEKPSKEIPKLNCQTCLKQFSDEESYKSHNFTACAAERATYTFSCSVCKARFKYKNHMRRHEDSHNNVRRYNCDVCTTAFLRPDHLKRHMMRMHGIVHLPTQNAPEKLILKPSPGPSTVQTSVVKSKNVTTKNVPMQCPMCKKILSRRDHLLRHMRNVHHVDNESRKRDRTGDPIMQGFGEGVMDLLRESLQNKDDKNDEEEDGSENQSMESHDGLLIDESYESVKRENCSPTPASVANSTSQNSLRNGSHQLDEATETPLNYSYNQFQNDLLMKMGARSSESLMMPHFSNDNAKLQKSKDVWHNVVNNAPKNKNSSDAELKSCPNSSDGNQNVLSNGSQNSGQDWISDLANLNGWQ
ncbi:Zinc finger protein 710 [Frankliniella fusca]|uniref:Zinc finger protein 710 n=1 Tax=Frankliniella fusca TaxID=407009 RepID=A0AAE1HSC3_9NEOP|nr:Zinc finger protein 710 [Frankliniella fusca]